MRGRELQCSFDAEKVICKVAADAPIDPTKLKVGFKVAADFDESNRALERGLRGGEARKGLLRHRGRRPVVIVGATKLRQRQLSVKSERIRRSDFEIWRDFFAVPVGERGARGPKARCGAQSRILFVHFRHCGETIMRLRNVAFAEMDEARYPVGEDGAFAVTA